METFNPTRQLDGEQIRIEQQQRKRVEHTFVGSQKKVAGHTLFEYNPATGEIKKAKIIYSDTILFPSGEPMHNPKVETVQGCVYRQALNKKDVIKHLRKEGYSKFKP